MAAAPPIRLLALEEKIPAVLMAPEGRYLRVCYLGCSRSLQSPLVGGPHVASEEAHGQVGPAHLGRGMSIPNPARERLHCTVMPISAFCDVLPNVHAT